MNINLEHYRIFNQVAKYQSITFAAESVFLTQPAVSQSIRQLELSLGCSLFIRSSKGVRLTPEGENLYFYTKRGIDEIEKGEKVLLQMRNLESGELHIGASDMTLKLYLLSYLEEFHKKYPKIKMHVDNKTTPETILNLQDGKIEFGVVTSPVPNENGLSVYPVCEIQDIFIAGSQYSDCQLHKFTFHQLFTYPMVTLEPGTSTRSFLDEFFLSQKLTLQPEFNLATTELIIPFVKRNFGIGIVPQKIAEAELQNGSIFEVKTKQQIPARNICIVTKTKAQLSQAGKAFLEFCCPL